MTSRAVPAELEAAEAKERAELAADALRPVEIDADRDKLLDDTRYMDDV
jgi:hypothetical protein